MPSSRSLSFVIQSPHVDNVDEVEIVRHPFQSKQLISESDASLIQLANHITL